MAIYYEYNIAVAPHVKKFVDKHFGEGSIVVSKGDTLGRLLLASLQEEPVVSHKPLGEHRVQLSVSDSRISEGLSSGRWLSAEGQHAIKRHFTEMYELKFYTYISIAVIIDSRKIAKAIDDFRMYYSITEDDIDVMSMRRSFNRIRVKMDLPNLKELSKISSEMCPTFNKIYERVLFRDSRHAIHRHRKANE